MEKQGNRDPNDKYYIPAIRIKMTLQPSEEEKALNGYQAPNEVLPGKHAELFDYVMLYSKDLYLLKTGNKVQNRSPREHPQRERQGENRQYNSYSQPQKRNEESRNWKDDREKFWQQQQEEQAEQQQQQQQQRSNQQLQNRGTKRRGEFRESNRGDRREQNKEQHRDTNQFRNDNDNEGQQRTNQHHFRKPEDFRRPKDRSTSNDNKRTVRPKFEEQQQEKSIKRGGELVRRGGPRKD